MLTMPQPDDAIVRTRMNNPSPLVPQGSVLEQKNKGRARVKLAVFLVLGIHGIGLLALLMQSCAKAPEPTPQAEQAPTNTIPAFAEQTNTAPAEPGLPPVATRPPLAPLPAAPGGVTEYKVVAGDIPVNIAKKFHITVQALMDANPGLVPTKLVIGQTLHIPPPTVTSPPTAPLPGVTPPTGDTAAGPQTYIVKSGDNLTKIAAQYPGVTVKALRTVNNLPTDQLKVGQPLIIPGKASAPAASGTRTPVESVPVPSTTPPAAAGR
jgi:LysM repeat protein